MKILSNKSLVSLTKTCLSIQKRWKQDKSSKPTPYDCAPDLSDRGVCAVEPCDALKCFTVPHVVIIGAGMAGLAAAARLVQRGINNIIILEAYERPGGRIHSCWLGDSVAELGANWESTNATTHPIYTLSANESPPRPGVPGVVHTRGLFENEVAGKTPFPPTILAYYKYRQIEEEAAQIYCLGGNKQHGSLINFMSIRMQQELHDFPEEHQHEAAKIMFGLTHMLSAKCGDDTTMLCADSFGCYMNMPGGGVRVPLGMIGIVAPLLRQIPVGSIHYCKPVNCIYWGATPTSGHRAIVRTADGEDFPADYVIITIPIGVLCRNCTKMFCPALPSAKVDALRCLGSGLCNKIYAEFLRPFWFWHKGNLNFKFDNSCACPFDWTTGIKSLKVVPNSKHVMCALVVGEEARMMEGLCDKDIAEGFTKVLRLSTGNENIPYPISILRSHWSTDPYFCGAYSFEMMDSCGEIQRQLANPMPGPSESVPPILLFAGEATIPEHYGTISGARLSGIREAERIVQLTIRYRGPPLPVAKPCPKVPATKSQ